MSNEAIGHVGWSIHRAGDMWEAFVYNGGRETSAGIHATAEEAAAAAVALRGGILADPYAHCWPTYSEVRRDVIRELVAAVRNEAQGIHPTTPADREERRRLLGVAGWLVDHDAKEATS